MGVDTVVIQIIQIIMIIIIVNIIFVAMTVIVRVSFNCHIIIYIFHSLCGLSVVIGCRMFFIIIIVYVLRDFIVLSIAV